MPVPPPDTFIEHLGAALAALGEGNRSEADRAIGAMVTERPSRRRRPSISKSTWVEVLRRDRFCCRYCGGRTVPHPVLAAASLVWPTEIPFNRNWRTDATHPIYVARTASMDHVVSHAHGGKTSLDNLVTACWPCNIQKGEFLLERLGWTLREPGEDRWDGFTTFYPVLWKAGRPGATGSEIKYHEAWLDAFEEGLRPTSHSDEATP